MIADKFDLEHLYDGPDFINPVKAMGKGGSEDRKEFDPNLYTQTEFMDWFDTGMLNFIKENMDMDLLRTFGYSIRDGKATIPHKNTRVLTT